MISSLKMPSAMYGRAHCTSDSLHIAIMVCSRSIYKCKCMILEDQNEDLRLDQLKRCYKWYYHHITYLLYFAFGAPNLYKFMLADNFPTQPHQPHETVSATDQRGKHKFSSTLCRRWLRHSLLLSICSCLRKVQKISVSLAVIFELQAY